MAEAFTRATHSVRGAPIPLTRSQISAVSKGRFAFLDLLREDNCRWRKVSRFAHIQCSADDSVMWVGRQGRTPSGLTTRQTEHALAIPEAAAPAVLSLRRNFAVHRLAQLSEIPQVASVPTIRFAASFSP